MRLINPDLRAEKMLQYHSSKLLCIVSPFELPSGIPTVTTCQLLEPPKILITTCLQNQTGTPPRKHNSNPDISPTPNVHLGYRKHTTSSSLTNKVPSLSRHEIEKKIVKVETGRHSTHPTSQDSVPLAPPSPASVSPPLRRIPCTVPTPFPRLVG